MIVSTSSSVKIRLNCVEFWIVTVGKIYIHKSLQSIQHHSNHVVCQRWYHVRQQFPFHLSLSPITPIHTLTLLVNSLFLFNQQLSSFHPNLIINTFQRTTTNTKHPYNKLPKSTNDSPPRSRTQKKQTQTIDGVKNERTSRYTRTFITNTSSNFIFTHTLPLAHLYL